MCRCWSSARNSNHQLCVNCEVKVDWGAARTQHCATVCLKAWPPNQSSFFQTRLGDKMPHHPTGAQASATLPTQRLWVKDSRERRRCTCTLKCLYNSACMLLLFLNDWGSSFFLRVQKSFCIYGNSPAVQVRLIWSCNGRGGEGYSAKVTAGTFLQHFEFSFLRVKIFWTWGNFK
jgi:hypothetical protein